MTSQKNRESELYKQTLNLETFFKYTFTLNLLRINRCVSERLV